MWKNFMLLLKGIYGIVRTFNNAVFLNCIVGIPVLDVVCGITLGPWSA
jgi:hypothetical protein